MKSKLGWALLSTAALLAAGCGGGGGGGGAPAGASSGVVSGTITGFGSVIVNGVRYRTSGTTTFDIDDGPGGQDDLAVGQQVTIRWTSDDGGNSFDADEVRYDDTVEGPIDAGSIDLANGTFVVLGQIIKVGSATSFDDDVPGRSLAGLTAGDRVEVSGLVDANGIVQATRIELDDDIDDDNDDEFEVRGIVTGLDPVAKTFVIGGLTVDYSGIATPPVLADGVFVEVEGNAYDRATDTLTATKVELDDDRDGRDDDDEGDDAGEVRIEGFVTAFTSVAAFEVNGRPVTTNSGTEFDDGAATDLGLNVRVEVEGSLDANGVLVADKVDVEDGDDDDQGNEAGIEDLITAIPAADTIVAGGVTIRLTARTRFEDHRGDDDEENQFLNAAALQVGDYVEVRGIVLEGNVVQATILERDDDDNDDAELRGPVTAISEPSFSILGVEVVTNGSTDFEDDDSDISAAQFFGAVSLGAEVKAKFDLGAAPRVAREVELESSDDDDDSNDDSDDDSDDDNSNDD